MLNKQVEELTDGAISAKAMGTALSAGVSISVGLAKMCIRDSALPGHGTGRAVG